MKSVFTTTALLLAMPVMALASCDTCALNMKVNFVEGAPVDRFVITNTSKVTIPNAEIEFDLRP